MLFFLDIAYAMIYYPFMKRTNDRRKIDGEWVKTLRKELGLTQGELAERLGVSTSAVARWEIKLFRPSKLAATVLLQLADTVGKDE